MNDIDKINILKAIEFYIDINEQNADYKMRKIIINMKRTLNHIKEGEKEIWLT